MNKIDLDRINYYLLLFFSFMLPLSRATDTIFSIYFSIYFFIYLIFNLKKTKIYKSNFFLITFIFILYTLLSLLWSSSNLKLGDATHYLQWFALFGVALFIKKEKSRVHNILTAFLLGMVVSEVLSYGMFFNLWKIHGLGAEEPTPFMMHIDYSIYIALAALILLNRLFSQKYSLKEKLIMSFFFITMSGNLFINGGRTGQLAFIIAIFAAFFLHFRVTLKNILIVLFFAASILTTAFYTSAQFNNRAKSALSDIDKLSKQNYESSWGQRVAMWKISPSIIKQNLIFGSGINSQKDVVSKFIDTQNPKYLSKYTKNFIKHNHLHNQFLQIVVELGVVGLILIFAIFYQISKFNIVIKEFKELKIIFLIIFIIGCLPEPLFLKQFTNALFILFVGLLFGLELNNKRQM